MARLRRFAKKKLGLRSEILHQISDRMQNTMQWINLQGRSPNVPLFSDRGLFRCLQPICGENSWLAARPFPVTPRWFSLHAARQDNMKPTSAEQLVLCSPFCFSVFLSLLNCQSRVVEDNNHAFY